MFNPLKFTKETDLCEKFIQNIPSEWKAYPEACNFDIVLQHENGWQIGIEAKLKLNTKLVKQAAEHYSYRSLTLPKPDFRAVLIPYDTKHPDLEYLLKLINVTIIRMPRYDKSPLRFSPVLPSNTYQSDSWFELFPEEKLDLPYYTIESKAGQKSPSPLSKWKIAALKIIVTLEKRGYVTRKDFAHNEIYMNLWSQSNWIEKDYERKCWVATDNLPKLWDQHPKAYEEIKNDYLKWCYKEEDNTK